MNDLEKYYNKFNEDKRLDSKRGQIEFITSMKYIHQFLKKDDKVLDIGAGTGKYSIELLKEGYDVVSLELVKHNIDIMKEKYKDINAIQGNALDLTIFDDETFDIVLLFGPMYHLKTKKEQEKALSEAKRVLKKEGIIFVAYCMNEYAIIEYGFKKNNIIESIKNQSIEKDFHINEKGNSLYNYVRIEDIDKINKRIGMKRIKIVAADGQASYIRKYLKNMDEETFNIFLKYHLETCERLDLIGYSTHTIDIITKI